MRRMLDGAHRELIQLGSGGVRTHWLRMGLPATAGLAGALGGTRTPNLLIRSRIPSVQPICPRPSGQLRVGAQSCRSRQFHPVRQGSVAAQ